MASLYDKFVVFEPLNETKYAPFGVLSCKKVSGCKSSKISILAYC